MGIDLFKGKTLKEIEKELGSNIVSIALEDKGNYGNLLASAYNMHGPKTCSFFIAASMYFMDNNQVLTTCCQEAFNFINDAIKILKEEKFDEEFVRNIHWAHVNNEYWVSMAGKYQRESDKEKHRNKWVINLEHMNVSELISLAYALMCLVYEKCREQGYDGLTTTEHIFINMSLRHMGKIMDYCSEYKKEKGLKK